MNPYRILVTGSRDWEDVGVIRRALEEAVAIVPRYQPITVVHGNCPGGADRHADHIARWMRGKGMAIDVEQHPAKGHPTQDFGRWPGAGPRRNAYMVSLGADMALAFIGPCNSPRCFRVEPHPSHGATGCARLAEQAGIPTRRWTA